MVATVVALAIIGVYALFYALDAAAPEPSRVAAPPDASTSSSPTPSGAPPVLTIKVVGAYCDVFVGIPQGNVLVNERMNQGDMITLNEPRMSAVVSNGAAAEVRIHGDLQPIGQSGQRQTFTISAEGASPAGQETADPTT